MQPGPRPIYNARPMVVGVGRGILLAIVAASCASDPWSQGVLVSIEIEDEATRPEFVLVTWFRGGEPVGVDTRVPDRGTFAPDGTFQASVFFAVNAGRDEPRKILVKGMRDTSQVSIGAERIATSDQRRTEVTVVLHRTLPDDDRDGLPDAIDDDCPAAPPSGCPARADAGVRPPDAASSADVRPTPEAPVEVPTEQPPAPIDLKSGLLAHWRFDEAAGSAQAADRSGSGNVGTLRLMDPATDWMPGRIGGALRFTGSGFVEAGSPTSLDMLTDRITLSGFVFRSMLQDGLAALVHRQVGTGSEDRLLFGLVDGRPHLRVSQDGITAATSLPSGRWVHVAAAYDGRVMRLFVDGREIAAASASSRLTPEPTP